MEPVISLIVATYKNENTLPRCVNSLINQKTDIPYEVIIVFDPSPDKTDEIAREFDKKYDFVHALEVHTRALGAAREQGVAIAKGDYCLFIDGDDYVSENIVQKMGEKIMKSQADVVCCGVNYVRKNKIEKSRLVKNKTYDHYGAIKALLKDSYMRGFMWNKMYRRELLVNKGFELPRKTFMREDVYSNFRIFLLSKKIVLMKDHLYFYDKTTDSATNSLDKERVPWFYRLYGIERYLLDQHGDEKLIKLFRRLAFRRKVYIWADRVYMKEAYNKEEYKALKKDIKKYLKIVKQKGPIPVEGMPWEDFIKNVM